MPLNVALIEPRIPPNTGNIARLCAAADTPLHLIGPLGFSLEEKEVRRAGLDYWDKTDLWVHENWFAFRDAISRDRCLYFSANAAQDYRQAPFRANSVLIFGNETDGLPARILEKHPDRCYPDPDAGRRAEPQPGECGERGAVRGAAEAGHRAAGRRRGRVGRRGSLVVGACRHTAGPRWSRAGPRQAGHEAEIAARIAGAGGDSAEGAPRAHARRVPDG